MIKNIIFDLGNIVINCNKTEIISKFAKNDDEKEYIITHILKSPEWGLMDLGNITNQEAADLINERDNFKHKDLTEEFLNNWYKYQTVNEDVVEIAKKLYTKGYRLYVLSNMANITFDFFKGNNFFKMCEGIIVSAHEHVKKPDHKIFEILLTRYNLNPQECLFIDDDDTGRSYETAKEFEILGRAVFQNDAGDIVKMLKEYSIEV